MAYEDITDTELGINKPAIKSQYTRFKANDEALADRIFSFEVSEQSTTQTSYTVVKEYPIYVPKSAKKLYLYGEIKVGTSGTVYAKARVKDASPAVESDVQTETSTSYQNKTWTFSDLEDYQGQNIILEIMLYRSGGSGSVYFRAERNLRSYFSRS